MKKVISGVPFKGTEQQKQKLMEVIEKYRQDPSPIMPVLQEAQEIYGYLPMEVQNMIAEGLDMPLEKIFGVTTFYSQFSLAPKGKYNISVCLGTACFVKGSQKIMDRLKERLNIEVGETTEDGKFSIEETRCVGACGLAPVFTVNGEVYGKATVQKLDQVLDELSKT